MEELALSVRFIPQRLRCFGPAATFKRPQDMVVKRLDYRGQRDDMPALRTFCSQIEDRSDEIAVDALCMFDVGR